MCLPMHFEGSTQLALSSITLSVELKQPSTKSLIRIYKLNFYQFHKFEGTLDHLVGISFFLGNLMLTNIQKINIVTLHIIM